MSAPAPLLPIRVHLFFRNVQGVWTLAHDKLAQIGKVAAAHVVQPTDQVSIITANGIALRTAVAAISQMGRLTRGVRIVNLNDGDTVAAMARLSFKFEEETKKTERRKGRERGGNSDERDRPTGERANGDLATPNGDEELAWQTSPSLAQG